MTFRTTLPLLLVFLLTACSGIKVNVNGEEKTYFGSEEKSEVAAGKQGDGQEIGEKDVTLAGDFAPSPYVVQSPNIIFNTSLGEKGWNDCGYKDTTQAPVLAFTLESPPSDLEVRLEGHPGVIVAPDGSVNCVETGLVDNVAWKEGTYEYYPKSTNENYKSGWGEFEFASPSRVQTEVAARLQTTIATNSKLNPFYKSVKVGDGPRVRASHVDLAPCMRRGRYFVVPVANLEVATTTKLQFDAEPYRPLFVRTADGKCLGPDKKKFTTAEVPAGKHQLYALWDRGTEEIATSYELAVFDEERKFAFDDAPTTKLGKSLDEPVTLVSDTGTPALRARKVCNSGSRQPAFYIQADERNAETPLKHLSGPGSFTVFGPLEKQFDKTRMCRESVVPKTKGTYVVFVNSSAANAPVVATLGDYREIDPLTPTMEVPAQLALDDRVVSRYFGYYTAYGKKDGPVEALFAAVPAQLFVFPKQAKKGILDNEPLLLVALGEDDSTVVRLTGERRKVRTSNLVTTPSGAVNLPELTAPDAPKNADEAVRFAGPLERRLYAQYKEREGEFRGCVVKYMKKHDKSWGKDFELVYLDSGETMTDRQFKKANAKCGLPKLEKFNVSMGKKMHQSRITSQKKAKQAIADKL